MSAEARISIRVVTAGDGARRAADDLRRVGTRGDETANQIRGLVNQITGLRANYSAVGGDTARFAQRMADLRDDAMRMADGLDEGSDEFARLQQAAALAAQGLRAAEQEMEGTQEVSQGMDFSQLSQGLFFVTESLQNIADLGMQAFEQLEAGAQSIELRESFKNQLAGTGQDIDTFLEKLQEASGNTISNNQLITTASKAMALNLTKDAEVMGQFLEVARFKARKFGQDTTTAFEDLTVGVGRQSMEILDNLGITINAEAVYKAYAQSIGVTVEELSNAQKTQAFLTAVIKEGQAEIERAGGLQDSAADKLRQQRVLVGEAKDAWLQYFAAVVTQVAPGGTSLAQTVTEAAQTKAKLDIIQAGVDAGNRVIAQHGNVLDEARVRWRMLTGDVEGARQILAKYPGALEAFNSEIQRSAHHFGMSTEKVREFDNALLNSGGNLGGVQRSVEKLNFGLRDLTDGFMRVQQLAREAFAAMGSSQTRLSLPDFVKKGVEQEAQNREEARQAIQASNRDIAAALQQRSAMIAGYTQRLSDMERDQTRAREDTARQQARALTDLERASAEARLEAFRSFAESIQTLNHDRYREELRLARDYAREDARIARDHAREDTRITRDLAREDARIRRDQLREDARVGRDADKEILRVREDFQRNEARSAEDHQRRLAEIARRADESIAEAIADRDGLKLVQARRQKERELSEEEEKYQESQKRAREDFEHQQKERQQAAEEERQDRERERQESAQDREEERRQAAQDRAEERRLASQDRGEERQVQAQDRAEAFRQQLADMQEQQQKELQALVVGEEKRRQEMALAELRRAEDAAIATQRRMDDLRTALATELAETDAGLSALAKRHWEHVTYLQYLYAEARPLVTIGTGAPSGQSGGSIAAPQATSGGSLGRVPGLATGGLVTSAGLAVVGERGPELLMLPRGANVIDNAATTAALGGNITIAAGAVQLSLHFATTPTNRTEMEEIAVDVFSKALEMLAPTLQTARRI